MAKTNQEIEPTTSGQMVLASGVDVLLGQIRPEWQAKSLIARVKALLPVDPSSACQRLLNAAIHDLRTKIIIAGLDVAQEAATANKLPSVAKPEDVHEYSTTNTLDLAYHMGLISRPEWRRLKRAYDIRKDLEHEDDEYEAGVEDCVYIFRTCIDVVLSKDPISPVRVTDVKDVIESPKRVVLSKELVEDFTNAPDKRQLQIFKFLISASRDAKKPDIVRQNAIETLRVLRGVARKAVKAQLGQHLQDLVKGKTINLADMKIAAAAGVTAYLKQARVREFFEQLHNILVRVGHDWRAYTQHGGILEDFEDVGGFEAAPADARAKIVKWMMLCYLGEPGGYGMGTNRPVFYSDVAAPLIESILKKANGLIQADFEAASKDRLVRAAISNKHIARRHDQLRDLIS
jgi:hypothetical protein